MRKKNTGLPTTDGNVRATSDGSLWDEHGRPLVRDSAGHLRAANAEEQQKIAKERVAAFQARMLKARSDYFNALLAKHGPEVLIAAGVNSAEDLTQEKLKVLPNEGRLES